MYNNKVLLYEETAVKGTGTKVVLFVPVPFTAVFSALHTV